MSTDTEERAEATTFDLSDPWWRLCHLYRIVDKEHREVRFCPNWAQARLYEDLWWRNVILKARQLGVSTFVCIYFLDCCVFNSRINAGLISETKEKAKEFIVDKVQYALERMGKALREAAQSHFGDRFDEAAYADLEAEWARARTTVEDNVYSITFDNGSSIQAGTSLRGGTCHLLHVSEMGKIAAAYPQKAREIVTGSMNAVPTTGKILIESTAEGRSGTFYDQCTTAQNLAAQGVELTPLDMQFHFFPWWEQPEYRLDGADVLITSKLLRYFAELETKIGRKLDWGQRCWYAKTLATQGDDMKREYPSCVARGVQVATPKGLMPIEDVEPGDGFVLAKYSKGVCATYRLLTSLGYELIATEDHPIRVHDGRYVPLGELSAGAGVVLSGGPAWPKVVQHIHYHPMPFVDAKIRIDQDMALFLGLYMGDGSFTRGCISICCDAQDTDVVDEVVRLLTKLAGESPACRLTGSKKGGVEVRISRMGFVEPFDAMGLTKRNGSGGLIRKICIPRVIKRSPRPVVAAFLRGLFEADGFAQRNGTGVKFFSKYERFARDVQLLLLQFSISSRLSSHDKRSGSGHRYEGWELSLRTEEARKFTQDIGFISARKRGRIVRPLHAPYAIRRKPLDLMDTVASIEPHGNVEVFDITTQSGSFSAGGIVVHNCPAEAFEQSIEGAYYKTPMLKARQTGRLCRVPVDPSVVVDTAWDIGMGDDTAIWFKQTIGREVHVIDYYENSGEGFEHYYRVLGERGYRYGRHMAPHDLSHREWLGQGLSRQLEIAQRYGVKFEIVPQHRIMDGINQTRLYLGRCWFDEGRCAEGLVHLDGYRKAWNERLLCWHDYPLHDEHSHGADAFRILAMGDGWSGEPGATGVGGRRGKPRNRWAGM